MFLSLVIKEDPLLILEGWKKQLCCKEFRLGMMKLNHVSYHPFPISFFAIISPFWTSDKYNHLCNKPGRERERFEFV